MREDGLFNGIEEVRKQLTHLRQPVGWHVSLETALQLPERFGLSLEHVSAGMHYVRYMVKEYCKDETLPFEDVAYNRISITADDAPLSYNPAMQVGSIPINGNLGEQMRAFNLVRSYGHMLLRKNTYTCFALMEEDKVGTIQFGPSYLAMDTQGHEVPLTRNLHHVVTAHYDLILSEAMERLGDITECAHKVDEANLEAFLDPLSLDVGEKLSATLFQMAHAHNTYVQYCGDIQENVLAVGLRRAILRGDDAVFVRVLGENYEKHFVHKEFARDLPAFKVSLSQHKCALWEDDTITFP